MVIRKQQQAVEGCVPCPRLFTANEFERMGEAGILYEDEHVELIEGEIVRMAAMGGPHYWCAVRINGWFTPRLSGRALVSIQNPIRLSLRVQPEPDIVLLRYRADYDEERVPGPEDVLLVIEIADTSLAYDRDVKLGLYAAAGIFEVWIVNLVAEQVLVYRSPQEGRYQETATFGRGETLVPVAFPDLALPVDEILPRRAPRTGSPGQPSAQ